MLVLWACTAAASTLVSDTVPYEVRAARDSWRQRPAMPDE